MTGKISNNKQNDSNSNFNFMQCFMWFQDAIVVVGS